MTGASLELIIGHLVRSFSSDLVHELCIRLVSLPIKYAATRSEKGTSAVIDSVLYLLRDSVLHLFLGAVIILPWHLLAALRCRGSQSCD